MLQRLTRRRFSQIAIASTIAVALSEFTRRSLAQSALPLVGVKVTKRGLSLRSVDLISRQVQDILNLEVTDFFDFEIARGITAVSANTLILSSTFDPIDEEPVDDRGRKLDNRPNTKKEKANQRRSKKIKVSALNTLGSASRKQKVVDLGENEIIGGVVVDKGKKLIGLASRLDKRAARLVEINTASGRVRGIGGVSLPQDQRFSNLTECPDGTLYTNLISRRGEVTLVQVVLRPNGDIAQINPRAQLSVSDGSRNPGAARRPEGLNGLKSLICSPTGQLIALADPRKSGFNVLFDVNPNNGIMTPLFPAPVNRVTLI